MLSSTQFVFLNIDISLRRDSRPLDKTGGGRGGHPDPEMKGGTGLKLFFRLFGPHFVLKIRGAGPHGSLPLDPSLKIPRRVFKGSLRRAGVCRQGLHSLKMKIDTPVMGSCPCLKLKTRKKLFPVHRFIPLSIPV